jgi:hypothetical protein
MSFISAVEPALRVNQTGIQLRHGAEMLRQPLSAMQDT